MLKATGVGAFGLGLLGSALEDWGTSDLACTYGKDVCLIRSRIPWGSFIQSSCGAHDSHQSNFTQASVLGCKERLWPRGVCLPKL